MTLVGGGSTNVRVGRDSQLEVMNTKKKAASKRQQRWRGNTRVSVTSSFPKYTVEVVSKVFFKRFADRRDQREELHSWVFTLVGQECIDVQATVDEKMSIILQAIHIQAEVTDRCYGCTMATIESGNNVFLMAQ